MGKFVWLTETIPSFQAGYTITPRHTPALTTSLVHAISSLQLPFSLYHWLRNGKAESDQKEKGLQPSASLTKEKLNSKSLEAKENLQE